MASAVNWALEESPFYKISKPSAQCNVSTENLFVVVKPESATHTDTDSLPPAWDGETIGKVKRRKFVGWDKESLRGKAKATHKSKQNMELIHCFL